ncbi:ABC transporter permease [Streptomyces alkaliphilus]|uniref:ABC transporter permease n=1 Tax=Streptomyces alkaliphilus TaxID=1472722 RepID=A0A7W3TG74_9ACTN|nr:ABC transporter permease [Streptomyces alkaliphilus]MBB0246239.1 ABC transporter permease [Streptomyces alkaliphilus]
MSAPVPSSGGPRLRPPAPGSGRAVIPVLVLVPVLAACLLWAFAWPAARTAPRELPLGVVGPPAAVETVTGALAGAGGDAFDPRVHPDRDAAAAAVTEREVSGAIVLGPDGPELLVASAGGPAVAHLLEEGVRASLGGADPDAAAALTVTDLVPGPAGDPRGAAFAAGLLPLTLTGVAAGALVVLFGLRGPRGPIVLIGACALVGTVAALLLHTWLGVLEGGWWAAAASLALLVLACAALPAGLGALLGPPGVGLGALTVVALGNPFSGAASSPDLLPAPMGDLGQALPPGAGASLLRSVAFFDGAGGTVPLLVLLGWAAAGLLLLGTVTRRRTAPADDPVPVSA